MTGATSQAESRSKMFLIHGPPGTGKTTYLARQAKRAAQEHSPSSVAIASLTRTAAAEIGGRDTGIPDDLVGTMHAHCFRALDRPKLAETPESIRAWNTAHPHLALSGGARDQLEDTIDLDGGQGAGDDLHAQVMNHRARRTPTNLWTPLQRDYHDTWTDWKAGHELLDFTDLIERCLHDVPRHPANPRVLLLDEAQDFSRLELDLALKWSEHTDTTVVVGDPCQALYAWRGSDPDALTNMPLAGERVLDRSYRVPRAVHDIAVRWVNQLGPDIVRAYQPTDQPGETLRHTATLHHPERLIPAIREDLDAGRTVMVLTSCGYMLAPVLKVLRREGIPFHNPYRVKQGAWNPMRAANRLLAFLRPDERVWGPEQSRLWTWDDLRLFTEPLQARGVLARGAKESIAEKCRPDRFGESLADQEVPTETLMTLLGGASLRHPVFRLNYDWWADNLLASKRKSLDYPLEVLRRNPSRPGVLLDKPKVVIGTIHCSPPDELVSTKRGPVPIAELREDDRLVGYHRGTNSVLGAGTHPNTRGYTFQRSVRPFKGDLVTIVTAASKTRVTPNHRVLARFDEEQFCERWVVYMMRRGDWWRVGICTSAHRPYRSGGVSGRLATEQADAGWILSVHDDRRSALAAEAYVQSRWGIPGLTFEAAKTRALDSAALHAVHSATAGDVAPRAVKALRDMGMDPAWPLYQRGVDEDGKSKRNLRGWFVTEAANLVPLSGRVAMATHSGAARSTIAMPATASFEPYAGPVYGLDVPPHHYYVSGGAVVHNSVKGGEADSVYVFPDLSRTGMWSGWHPGGAGRDQIIRMIYVALTRARHKVTILNGAGAEHVPLQLLTADLEAVAA